MAINTAEDFFGVLGKSRLLQAEQMDAARAAGRQSDDPTSIARILVRKELLTRWQAGQLLAGRSSLFLGKYKLIEQLGRGGTGSVFLGQHVTMNRRAVLKIISRRIGKDPAALERFLAEARAVAALDHPNIAHVYSFDNQGDRYYMVTEYVDGRDLERMVAADGPADCRRAADYIRQAADGLAHGHQNNIIHGDVRPSNLLVNEAGVVKIVDMGLARLTGRGPKHLGGQRDRDEQKLLSSVDYLSPEQAAESPHIDPRADVYSLGCTFYFLLTGRPPFAEGLLHERLMKHQTQPAPDVRRQREDTPEEMADLCRSMMAKRPQDRPQSAQELSRALSAWRLPQPRAKPPAPLKVAQTLEEPVEDLPPNIDVDAAPKVTGGDPRKAASRKTGGLLHARRQKIIATVIAVLLPAVILAVAIPLLSRPPTDSDQPPRPRVAAAPARANDGPPADQRPPADDQPKQGEVTSPPPEEPPAGFPLVDDPLPEDPRPRDTQPEPPPAEDPQSTPPQPETPTPENPQPEIPEPKQPGPADPEPDRPQPEDPGLQDPPPQGPQPRESQPRESQPRESQPRESQKRDPFRDLPPAVRLPALNAKAMAAGQSTRPVSLGLLHLGPEDPCKLELLGGKDTGIRNRQFLIEPEAEGTSWLVQLESRIGVTAEPKLDSVAQIRLDGQTLEFQWLEEAPADLANQLRKCGLSVRVGGKTRWLALAAAEEVQPLVVPLNTGTARSPLPRADWMPQAAALRFQVTRLDVPLPKPEFQPPERVSEKGQLEVRFRKERLPHVRLHLSLVSGRRRPEIAARAEYRLADQNWYRLARGEVQNQVMDVTAEYERLKRLTQAMEHKKAPGLEVVMKRRNAFKTAREQLQALGEAFQNAPVIATVHFRVFMTVGDQRVVLFTTGQAEAEDRPDQGPGEHPGTREKAREKTGKRRRPRDEPRDTKRPGAE